MRKLVIVACLVCAPAFAATLDEARGLIDSGSYDQARTILERSVEDSALKPAALTLLTLLNNRIEDYEEGVRYGKQAVKVSPDSADAHFQYAVALRTKMSKVSKVKAMFSLGTYKKELKKALELDPDDTEARNEEIGFLVTAPGVAGGDVDQAWQRALELEKLDWRDGLRWQAVIQFKKENIEGSLATSRKLLEKDPTNSGARFQLAYRYQSLERYEEADREFAILQTDEAEQIAMNALYQRARTRVLGRYEQEQAVEFLQQYIDAMPRQAAGLPGMESAYWRMGNAYEQLGRADDARRAYEKSLQIEETDEARDSLKSLGKKR
jgi:tetratricopeptide (TPR) repeat protein